jgi:hypothetical protein
MSASQEVGYTGFSCSDMADTCGADDCVLAPAHLVRLWHFPHESTRGGGMGIGTAS